MERGLLRTAESSQVPLNRHQRGGKQNQSVCGTESQVDLLACERLLHESFTMQGRSLGMAGSCFLTGLPTQDVCGLVGVDLF